jgi:hypothetical protein
VLDADGEQVGDPQEVRLEPGRTGLVEVPDEASVLRLQVRSGQVAATTVLWSQPDGAPPRSLVSAVPVLVPPAAPDSVVVGRLSPDVLRAPAAGAP